MQQRLQAIPLYLLKASDGFAARQRLPLVSTGILKVVSICAEIGSNRRSHGMILRIGIDFVKLGEQSRPSATPTAMRAVNNSEELQ